jgi:hypothetical protein
MACSVYDDNGKILQNLETAQIVSANVVDVLTSLHTAHSLACEIADACKKIREELLRTEVEGVSLRDLREALVEADRSSNHIDKCHADLLDALQQARDAAGSNEPLLKPLRAAQTKADQMANTQLAKSLQAAKYQLELYVLAPTLHDSQVEKKGESGAISTPNTSIVVSSKSYRRQLVMPVLRADLSFVDGGQSPAVLETRAAFALSEDDIDGCELNTDYGEQSANDQSNSCNNNDSRTTRSDGDVINNNPVIVPDGPAVPLTDDNTLHAGSASRMVKHDGTDMEADFTKLKKV